MDKLWLLLMGLVLVGSVNAAIYDGFTEKPGYFYNYNRDTHSVLGVSSTEYMNLTFTPEAGSRYLIIATTYWSSNSPTLGAYINFTINKTTTALYRMRLNTASSIETRTATYSYIVNGTGKELYFAWNHRAANSTVYSYLSNGMIVAIRLDNITGVQYNHTYRSASVTNINNVWADATTDHVNVSITPSSQKSCLIMGNGAGSSAGTSTFIIFRLAVINSTNTEYVPIGVSTSSNYTTRQDSSSGEYHAFNIIAVRNLSADKHTISMQAIDGDTTASADIRHLNALVVCFEGSIPFLAVNDTVETSTTSTTYQNKSIITLPVGNNGTYLVLGGFTGGLSSTSYDWLSRLTVNNTGNNTKFRAKHANDKPTILQGLIFNASSGSYIINNQFAREDATGTAYAKSSEILLLALDWPVTAAPPSTSCTCPGSGTWEWDFADNCNITSNCSGITTIHVKNNNAGTWKISAVITATNWFLNGTIGQYINGLAGGYLKQA